MRREVTRTDRLSSAPLVPVVPSEGQNMTTLTVAVLVVCCALAFGYGVTKVRRVLRQYQARQQRREAVFGRENQMLIQAIRYRKERGEGFEDLLDGTTHPATVIAGDSPSDLEAPPGQPAPFLPTGTTDLTNFYAHTRSVSPTLRADDSSTERGPATPSVPDGDSSAGTGSVDGGSVD